MGGLCVCVLLFFLPMRWQGCEAITAADGGKTEDFESVAAFASVPNLPVHGALASRARNGRSSPQLDAVPPEHFSSPPASTRLGSHRCVQHTSFGIAL